MLFKRIMLPVAVGFLLYSCGATKKVSQQKNVSPGVSTTAIKADTTKNAVSKLKPYKDVITNKAVTAKGLLKVHKVDDKYYFEIPDSLLERDILIVNRISKAAAYPRFSNVVYAYAGDQIGESVIAFSRGPSNKIFIKQQSYRESSKDSTDNGMYRSVRNSNLQPIVAVFDIKAFSPDSMGVVLDMTDYINGDNDILYFDKNAKDKFKVAALQNDKSYIDRIQSFPLNVEIRAVKTYVSVSTDPTAPATKTYELNSSLVLLPKITMQPRYLDDRIGYFSSYLRDYDANPQGVKNDYMITRWRLEPKPEDIERYKRGELVEPSKPIVFYIDPTTPKKWVSYLIAGVNDWQKAFEQAGFKNAIYALEAPKNDPEWSLEDARHNAIVYKPSDLKNASGPNVHDPRTGEILETHINWYHNVMSLIHDWYFVQAGAIDPRARKMEFDDSLMGKLIRFVSSHEVGHTLGLMHNFGASSTVPVDSLRNKRWVEANGFCPSIMDYARFNYVAQPEDSISEKGILPRIGVYDKWAIEWGYRWLPDLHTRQEEKLYLDKWVIESQRKDKRLWFGGETNPDLRCNAEDLGDNAAKAGIYGIKNLKRILPHLIEWTKAPGGDYGDLVNMQMAVLKQYTMYLSRATSIIGGIYCTPKTVDQEGTIFGLPSRDQQKEALAFLQKELFTTPEWVMDKRLYALTGIGTPDNLLGFQHNVLKKLLSQGTLNRLEFNAFYQPQQGYTTLEFFQDINAAIWSEFKNHQPIDTYRRNLQKVYIELLVSLLQPPSDNPFDKIDYNYNKRSDVSSLVKEQIRQLVIDINSALPIYEDKITKMHLKDLKERLNEALKVKKAGAEAEEDAAKNLGAF